MLMTRSLENSLTTAPQLTTSDVGRISCCCCYTVLDTLAIQGLMVRRARRHHGVKIARTSKTLQCRLSSLLHESSLWCFSSPYQERNIWYWKGSLCAELVLYDMFLITATWQIHITSLRIWYSAMCFRVLLYCWSVHIKKLSPIPYDSHMPVYCLPEGMFIWA